MVFSTTTAASGNSFSQTFQFITGVKLQELEKQRQLYETHAHVVDEARALGAQGDVLKQVAFLAKAVKSERTVGGRLNLNDLEFWLQQARTDPSFSREIAARWVETLEEHIRHTTTRFDAATLFGKLFNEWLASGDSVALAYQAGPDEAGAETTAPSAADYVEIGRKEMYEQKEKLPSIIFEEPSVDITQLTQYLEALFESEEATRSLEQLRKEFKSFGTWLQRKLIYAIDVKHAIAGLLASGLMDEDERTMLKVFQGNPTGIQEVASVLTMRMTSLDSWEWPKGGILVEFRRHMNGKYRAFTDPEIVDALLLHHSGVVWQVKLKEALFRIFHSRGWVRPTPPTHTVKESRIAQLRGDDGTASIEAEREKTRRMSFFLTQLQDDVGIQKPYDDLGDAPKQATANADSPAVIKQKLLQIMTTESYLSASLHGTHRPLL